MAGTLIVNFPLKKERRETGRKDRYNKRIKNTLTVHSERILFSFLSEASPSITLPSTVPIPSIASASSKEQTHTVERTAALYLV